MLARVRLFVLCTCLAFFSATAHAKESSWIEVRSLHFRVLTDGSAGEARRIAHEFEQMRTVFATSFPDMRLETGSPLLIFAPLNEYTMKSMAPALWNKNMSNVAGFFETRWEKRFAVVRLDQDVPGAYQVVYHEYVHSLLHANLHWLPVWLDEGLAEYYGGTRFEKSKIYVGAPVPRVLHLRGEPLIPVEKLLTVNPHIAYRGDDRRVDLFYGESWALVHYFTFGPGMEQGKKLNEYYGKLQQGADQSKAFTEIFGSFQQVDKGLDSYFRNFAFTSYVLTLPEQDDEKSYASRKLSQAEIDAAIGCYRLWSYDLAEAREITEAGLKDDPKLGELHQNLGFLYFADGKDPEALREFETATQLDGQLYLSLYFKAMLSPAGRMETPADTEQLRAGLMQVLKINPNFAEVYARLAVLQVRADNLSNALAVSRRAEQLEPTRAGYHLLSGKIMLRQGRGTQAGEFAKFVVDRWHGPDHNEAVELWNSVPDAQRTSAGMPFEDAAGAQVAQGTVKSTTCGDSTHPMTLVLESEGKPLSFKVQGEYQAGFSDTLWYGADHFSPCRHLDGLRAVVRYKVSDDNKFAGNIVSLEFRDDLPQPFETAPGAVQNTQKPASQ